MPEAGLVGFARMAMEVATAVPPYRSKSSNYQYTQIQLVSMLCLMRYEDRTFRETGVRLAEHAWALLLGLLRCAGRAVRESTWDIRQSLRDEAWELEGKTLGIIGLGGSRIEVAKRAQGFDMQVIATDPEDVPRPPFVREVWRPDRFYDLLEQSDVVVICAP